MFDRQLRYFFLGDNLTCEDDEIEILENLSENLLIATIKYNLNRTSSCQFVPQIHIP